MLVEEAWTAVNDVLVANNEDRKTGGDGERACWVLGGDRPTEADASLYGMLVAVLIASS